MSNPSDKKRATRFGPFAAVMVGLVSLTVVSARSAFPQILTRTEQAVGYVLQLEEVAPIRVRSVSGGEVMARTLTVTPLIFGWDLSPVLVPWVSRTVQAGASEPTSIVLSSVDLRGSVVARKLYDRAVLTGVYFPGLNSASADAGMITLRVQSSRVTDLKTTAIDKLAPAPPSWKVRNFRVEIDAMPTETVSSVEPFAWTSQARVQNLRVTMPFDRFAWARWADWVGRSQAAETLNGRVRLLDTYLQRSLMTVDLRGLTPVRIARNGQVVGEDDPGTFTVELAVEALRLSY